MSICSQTFIRAFKTYANILINAATYGNPLSTTLLSDDEKAYLLGAYVELYTRGQRNESSALMRLLLPHLTLRDLIDLEDQGAAFHLT